MVSCCNGSMQRRVCAIGHKVVHTSLCRSVAARQFLAAQVRSRAWVPRAVASVPWRVHGWCGVGPAGRSRLSHSPKPPSPPRQRVRRGTRGGSGRRRRRRGGAAAGGGGDVTKVGMSVKWCGSVFQRLFAAAACVPPAGRVVRAPLRRATVPGRTRACLHGHFRPHKSGRRAGAEHGCMRRRGGCMRGAGGGRADHDIFRSCKRPLPCVGALERGRTGGGSPPCLCPRRVLPKVPTRAAPLCGPVDAYFGPKTPAFSAKNPLPWTQRDCSVCTACRTRRYSRRFRRWALW